MVRAVGLIVTLVLGILAAAPFSAAQQPPKIPRIGILFPGTCSTARQYVDAFRQGLRELGYVGGQNIAIESRTAEGSPERLPLPIVCKLHERSGGYWARPEPCATGWDCYGLERNVRT